MRNLILLFVKFGNVLLFLALEFICLFLIVNFNDAQQEIWVNSINIFSGRTTSAFDEWTDYFNLKQEAEKLAAENARLRSQLSNLIASEVETDSDSINIDSSQFTFIPAKIRGKTISQPDNYFVIDKGERQGVQQGMGVISSNGIVGIVASTSTDMAKIITILNRQSSISVGNSKNGVFNGAFGTLKWKNFTDYEHVQIEAYPRHHPLLIGDTIVTTGYTEHFPEGVMVGIVDTVALSQSDYFYDAKIKLTNNLSLLKHVYVIKNHKQNQYRALIGN